MIVLLIILLYIVSIMSYCIHRKNEEISKCKNSINDLSNRIELIKESDIMSSNENRESKSYEYIVCLLCGNIYRSYDIKNVSSSQITENGDYILADSDGRIMFLANNKKIFFIAKKNVID